MTDINTVQALWTDAYAAFKGAFDTPQSRRQQPDEYSQDARRRLREFDEQFRALIAQMQRDAVQPVARMSLVRLDEQYRRALAIAIESGRASVSMIQRKLGIRYSQAQELVARMLRDGLVSIEDTPGLQHDAADAPHPEAQASRHATKENGDCPQWCKACKVEAESRAQQQDDHAGSPAPSRVDLPARVVDTVAASVGLSGPFDQDFYDFAQALMMEVLARAPAPSAESSKAALSDDDFNEVEVELLAQGRFSLANFARAILARAGIGESRREPLTIEQIRDAVFNAGLMFTGPDEMVARAIEAAHGITPQAGKESGDV